ncbi:glycosyltransferase [Candidatus Bathyarchaeota archaeon]|nr:glycosyltransferase [Candidatus Bathyarchaeota archaeon]
MRICYLANASSIHTRRWVKYFVEKGHEIHIISFENAQIEGTVVHVLKLPLLVKNATFPIKVASIFRIKSILSRIKPDVLHAHYVTNYGLFGALCNFKPFVVTAWGSDILAVGTRIVSMVKAFIARYVLREADIVTCDAQHMKEAMRKLGIAPEKIDLICFGVDTRKFSPREKSETLRTKLSIHDSPTVISLRNLDPLYDVESLIKSIPFVLEEIPETKFLIAGKGSEERRLKELAESLGVSDSLKFVGFISNDELPQYLNTVDVYVSTSLSDAGIAASTAEAMACGLPVIVTDVADNRDWVEDGVNGFVVPIKNPKALAKKTIYLLENNDIRKGFGNISRKIIEERNNYYKEMENMENIYKKLMERT